jgi:metal-responsive CopG/Arc/MetJ family transcriptional regulator
MATSFKKTVRAQLWLTPELNQKLEQLIAKRERSYTRADLIRDAIRRFVDEEAEVLGSKAHQARTFQKSVEQITEQLIQMEQRLATLNQVQLQLCLLVFSILVSHVRAVEQAAVQTGAALPQKNVSPQTLLDHALRLTQSGEGQSALAQIWATLTEHPQ